MVDFEIKDCYKFDDLLRIMEILRAPDGCMCSGPGSAIPITTPANWVAAAASTTSRVR